ncbi:MAG: hypothetical protein JJ892_12575 [Balneola sp.]|nr:hypothetical protein [Balneola sp.]MBO6651067.1 hypothetical protein [Balneola sp.]MBO6712805.1 hypothetical protein [Balneola sp.]MBO6801104.1 hypothetical protein [Balneola sp.]MBO6871296.1 hypothetical protein [Balneola sp.]
MRSLLFVLIFVGSCIDSLVPECSTISGKTAYQGTIITDEPFEDYLISAGDTLVIRPEYKIHGFNRYVGSEACEGESYELRPDFIIHSFNQDLINAELIEDPNGNPRYNDASEILIRITGLSSGKDSVNIEARFSYFGYRESFVASKKYLIEVEVQ